MPSFSGKSAARLAGCHPDLQRVLNKAIERYDFTVLCGHRTKAAQELAYTRGNSTLRWPHSKHNAEPALAVDIAPWPLDWSDTARFRELAHYVLGVADALGVPLRWGGDWDRDFDSADQRFDDLPHFELAGERDADRPSLGTIASASAG